jgi:hypothetical protein
MANHWIIPKCTPLCLRIQNLQDIYRINYTAQIADKVTTSPNFDIPKTQGIVNLMSLKFNCSNFATGNIVPITSAVQGVTAPINKFHVQHRFIWNNVAVEVCQVGDIPGGLGTLAFGAIREFVPHIVADFCSLCLVS